MDLLNFWINRYNFHYKNEILYINLKSHSNDEFNAYCMPLSNDKIKIFDFFGFDVNIDFDKLTLYNQFEYLCESNKLNPKFITYNALKDYISNVLNRKFNTYLLIKNYPKYDHYDQYELESNILTFKKEAIEFFDKQKEYDEYKKQRELMDTVFNKKKMLDNVSYDDFNKFCILYGILNIVDYDDETLKTKWQTFKSANWSGLSIFI